MFSRPKSCHAFLGLYHGALAANQDVMSPTLQLLGSTHLSYCLTRADKLRFLFHELDKVGT